MWLQFFLAAAAVSPPPPVVLRPPLPEAIAGVSRVEERCETGDTITTEIIWTTQHVDGERQIVHAIDVRLNQKAVLDDQDRTIVTAALNRWTREGFHIRDTRALCPIEQDGPFVIDYIVRRRNSPLSPKELITLRLRALTGVKPDMSARRKIGDRWTTVPAETADVLAPASSNDPPN